MEINRLEDLDDIANLGLTLAEAKRFLAKVQREVAAAQARKHAVRRPICLCDDRVCQVKDYRDHAVASRLASTGHRIADRRGTRLAAGSGAFSPTSRNCLCSIGSASG
jgi:hypothetical protein